MAKADKFIVTSPVAEFGYAHLRTPDTKFNQDGGDYKLDFFLEPEAAREFVARIESDPRAVVKGKKSKVKATKVDGTIKFRTKQKAIVRNKAGEQFDVKPRLFYIVDGQTVPYPEDKAAPYAGSRGEVEVEVVPFEGFGGGLSLRLRAVRLHEIVEGASSGGAAGDWGDVPADYTAGVTQAPERTPAGDDSDDDDGDDHDSLDDRW